MRDVYIHILSLSLSFSLSLWVSTAPVAPSTRSLPAHACMRARVENVDRGRAEWKALHGLICDQKQKRSGAYNRKQLGVGVEVTVQGIRHYGHSPCLGFSYFSQVLLSGGIRHYDPCLGFS